MVLYGFGHGAKDDAQLGQLVLERGGYRDAVEDGVHGHAGEHLLLFEGDAQLLVGSQNLGIDLVEAVELVPLGGRVVHDVLVVDVGIVDHGPTLALFAARWILHREPAAIGFEPPLEHELRLVLFGGDEADELFVEAGRGRVGLHIGDESPLVVAVGKLL